SDSLFIPPIRKYKLVQQFDADGDSRGNFVTCAQCLLQFTGLLCQPLSFPPGFDGRVVIDNQSSEVLLRDQFRLEFEMLAANADLFIEGKSDGINNRIGQIVDKFDGAAFVRKSVTVCAVVISPIERI